MDMATNAPLKRAMAGWLEVDHHDDGFAPARLVQVLFEKFPHFAASFADQRNHVDIRLRLAGNHPQQGGFAHAAARKNPHALAAAARA